MKTISTLILSGVIIFSTQLQAQVDEARMDKDLRVAAKVLESLTQGDDSGYLIHGDNVEANYVDGYGVIFTIGGGYSFYMGGANTITTYGYSSGSGQVVVAPRAEEKSEKGEEAEIKELDFSEVMVEFLIDYSQMINQLKPEDKIMVSTKKSDHVFVGRRKSTEVAIDRVGGVGISVEMTKKDHNDFIGGKLSREKLVEKIKIIKDSGESSRSKDLDLFSSMLSTVYDDEYTDSYFISWKPEYQRLAGVGAIYSFKVYSSYDEDGWYRMPGIDKKGLNSEERNAEVEKLYPIFVSSMKENIIQYGRTITSLEPDEMILLKVTLTKCDNCSIPKKIQFSIKQADLTAFRSGKISEKEARAKVTVSDL